MQHAQLSKASLERAAIKQACSQSKYVKLVPNRVPIKVPPEVAARLDLAAEGVRADPSSVSGP